MSNKKTAVSVIAIGTAAAMLLGGTFAWQSISQTALNEASDIVNPGGRLHNDLYYVDARINDSNIYVENFADDEIFARVRLQEYMEIVMNYGTGAERVEVITGSKTPKADADVTAEDATSKDQFDYTYTTHQFGEEAVNDTADYFAWTMGAADSEAVYMPTFNVNKDSLAADLHGLYVDRVGGISSRGADQYTEEAWTVDETKTGNEIYDGDTNSDDELKTLTIDELDALINDGTGADAYADHIQLVQAEHTAAAVGTTRGLISMEDWLALGDEADTDRYWVYDTDGWVYWSSPIAAHSTTGLLLDGFALQQVMDDTWYYAIQAEGQFITANDAGKENGTGFYASTEDQPSAEAETLLRTIGVDLGADAGEGETPDDDSDDSLTPARTLKLGAVGEQIVYSYLESGEAVQLQAQDGSTFADADATIVLSCYNGSQPLTANTHYTLQDGILSIKDSSGLEAGSVIVAQNRNLMQMGYLVYNDDGALTLKKGESQTAYDGAVIALNTPIAVTLDGGTAPENITVVGVGSGAPSVDFTYEGGQLTVKSENYVGHGLMVNYSASEGGDTYLGMVFIKAADSSGT